MHALVIEDQFLIATLVEDELRDLGYTTVTLCDCEEHAVASASEQCPDLITADDKLTTGSGVEAVRAICADRIIPVVFIVDNPSKIVSPVPYSTTIGKPFSERKLRAAVKQAVSRAQVHAL